MRAIDSSSGNTRRLVSAALLSLTVTSCVRGIGAHGATTEGVVAPAAEITQPDSLLDRLVGSWVLRGTIDRQQVVHDVTARWVLGSEYVELHEISRERTPAGSPAYEAIVYVGRDPRTHEYAALWLDNTAYGAFDASGVGHGNAVADSIPFLFTTSPTVRFHNTFVYDRKSDSWQWHMDNDDERGRRPFARVTLTRH